MKTLKFLVSAALVALSTAQAMATPVYYGATSSSIGEGAAPKTPAESGYYIWSNDAERKRWSVRWTSNNGGTPVDASWFGSIMLGGAQSTGPRTISFMESGDSVQLLDVPGISEFITWTSFTNHTVTGSARNPQIRYDNWDGFNFTITGDVGNVIGFRLGSSLLRNLIVSSTPVLGRGIFIGGDNDGGWNNPETLVQSSPRGPVQVFEIPAPVPEPGTLVLFSCAGIVGLVLMRRRKQN